jgi:hypothetical protein
MKANKKINVVDAVKFIYNSDCIDEITKLLSFAELEFNKARHPYAIGELQIETYKGLSLNKHNPIYAKEGDWIIVNPDNDREISIVTEKNFVSQYDLVL